jgi:hypothetical protein
MSIFHHRPGDPNEIAKILGNHPVTAGRSAERGKRLIDNYEEIWDILEKRS